MFDKLFIAQLMGLEQLQDGFIVYKCFFGTQIEWWNGLSKPLGGIVFTNTIIPYRNTNAVSIFIWMAFGLASFSCIFLFIYLMALFRVQW